MPIQLRTEAVKHAIKMNRIDESSAQKIDAAVVLTAKYQKSKDEPLQADVLASREGMEPAEQLVYDRAYGEVMGRGYKHLAQFVKEADAPPPAPPKAAAARKEAPESLELAASEEPVPAAPRKRFFFF